jgi:NAD(P)-dependent dehydrogenase (short-subunit alcohol dehydrogenase family)
MDRFTGKTAIVTGASRGIGLAIARRLVAEGATVVITARKHDVLEQAVESLGGPDVAMGVAGRADDNSHQAEVVRGAIERFGSLDCLVNNTGINPTYGPILELDKEAARKVVDVNCLAALDWMRQAYEQWMRQHGGSVVNVTSVAGIRPAPGIGFYGASKAMLNYLTQELAIELAPRVRVNAVAPAVVKTQFAGALYDGKEAEVAAAYPMGRLGLPDDISGAVAHLLSDDAGWMTGQTLVVDGGLTLTGGV